MKRISSKLLYCLLLAFIFVLNSCENEQYEDAQDTKNAVKTYYITGEQAQKVATKLGGTLNKTLSNKGTTFKAGDDDGVTVDYSSIMVVDKGTDIAYSLKADSNTETDLIFQNVVMEEKGNETVTKLITYKMTPQFAADYKNDLRDISQFRGEIIITTLSGKEECHPTVETIPFNDNLPIITLPTAGNTVGGGGSSSGQGGGGGENGTGPVHTSNGSTGSGNGSGGWGGGWYVINYGVSVLTGSGSNGSYGTNGGDLIGVPGGQHPSGGGGGGGGAHVPITPKVPHQGRLTYVPSNTGTADGSDYDCETDIGIYEDNYSITEKPCVKLRTKSLEPLFKGKVDSLNKPAVYSLNYESGFFQTKASATTSTLYPKAAPLPNTHTITYVPPSSVSLVHVHNDTFIDELGDERHTVKMLSPGDLFTFMGKFQDNALAAGVPAEDTYAMMISRQGTYCLKITASGPLNILSSEQKTAFFNEYDENAKILYSDLELTDTANQDKLEHLLLDLLKEFFLDDKIGLFKATNADLTEWNQKKLNTAGVIETVPCI